MMAILVAVPPFVDTFTKYSAAWPRLMLVSLRCTLTHRLPGLVAVYASSDACADLADEADVLLDLADGDAAGEEEVALAVGLGELVVGGSVGDFDVLGVGSAVFDAVGVGFAVVDFDGVGVGEGLLGVGVGVGVGLGDGSEAHPGAVVAAKAAA